ncbi:energy-coupling factor transporter transmembrane component T family protein [Argonema antarcticum]|uniref:energy-coupling factor transporter transmembrane component T family protein n=1 Tax=Argonema antarcticum TaxID=2942763 RepID=UPI0020124EAF|nr:energy-coupling factor transporter transmembrane protein EcfT [Argonema antarcticum]MCL1469152.1 energy-coupling factor transporter transmembrane protein EcfT [Argonema antarcticum A004/B2]
MDLLRSLPLGLYLEEPTTWLHKLDPRVKLGWLMSFLFAPILANASSRIALSVLLILITLTARIPLRVWRQQMVWLLILSIFVFFLSALAPDGMAVSYQPRLPADEMAFVNPQPGSGGAGERGSGGAGEQKNFLSAIANLKSPGYSYIVFKQGPIAVTRRSLDLAIRVSTLLFTLIYSTNLYLLTTAPEEITAGIESLMRPLRRFNWPVTEIVLTLTLSLRFIPLVLEEVQNLVRSVWTRAINWKKLGLRRAIRLWMTIAERLLKNLLLRADQIASAMKVRGFTSPDRHRVEWSQLRMKRSDWLAIATLAVFWGVRLIWGNGEL